jgi:uncharacterized protein (TIGR01777 family)
VYYANVHQIAYHKNMLQKILIAGGSGLLGSRLAQLLLGKGYEVAFLSRNEGRVGSIKKYRWDIASGYIDPEAFENTTAIVNLAGAGVFAKAWSETYKEEIRNSRIASTSLLVNKLSTLPNKIHTFVNASAIGIYGCDTGSTWQDEASAVGEDFLAQVVNDWELAAMPLEQTPVRLVRLRIGIVLSPDGGAYTQMAGSVRLFAGMPLASGAQYLSWIHIDDLCSMFLFALENKSVQGVYNAVAPTPATNKEFTYALGVSLRRPIWPIHLPAAVLKIALGRERALLVIGGNKVLGKKIVDEGFKFQYTILSKALKSIAGK